MFGKIDFKPRFKQTLACPSGRRLKCGASVDQTKCGKKRDMKKTLFLRQLDFPDQAI